MHYATTPNFILIFFIDLFTEYFYYQKFNLSLLFLC